MTRLHGGLFLSQESSSASSARFSSSTPQIVRTKPAFAVYPAGRGSGAGLESPNELGASAEFQTNVTAKFSTILPSPLRGRFAYQRHQSTRVRPIAFTCSFIKLPEGGPRLVFAASIRYLGYGRYLHFRHFCCGLRAIRISESPLRPPKTTPRSLMERITYSYGG
jgi:hypothetical protein